MARPPGPSEFRYRLVRLSVKAIVEAYVGATAEGAENLPPSGGYIICFNHPSWMDPGFLTAAWPDRERRLFIFGPREQDMSTGIRNRFITWTGKGVPFKPDSQDVLDVTRRSTALLKAGACLAVAGEGRLSDHEGEILPLETGLAHFALLASVPIVPTAIIGSRWVHFQSGVRIVIGSAVDPGDFARGRAGARAMTDVVAERLTSLLAGVEDRDPPGWFGRNFSEAFNDRPWLDEIDEMDDDDGNGQSDQA